MEVIAKVTLVVGDGQYAVPGTAVQVKDADEARSLVAAGYARWPEDAVVEGTGSGDTDGKAEGTPLPDEFPGREHLVAAGYGTVEAVRGIADLDALPGIGQATEAKILEVLEGLKAAV